MSVALILPNQTRQLRLYSNAGVYQSKDVDLNNEFDRGFLGYLASTASILICARRATAWNGNPQSSDTEIRARSATGLGVQADNTNAYGGRLHGIDGHNGEVYVLRLTRVKVLSSSLVELGSSRDIVLAGVGSGIGSIQALAVNATHVFCIEHGALTVRAWRRVASGSDAAGSRDSSKDIVLDSANTKPTDLAIDSSTMLVADDSGNVYAYTIPT